ncbi:putative cytochrome P450 phenylacetate 2-hydroxylase [Ramaria rubella]|nr:putative cytochrome P450 phenylacetate 2-hydroxylase [Ramaria rubella]
MVILSLIIMSAAFRGSKTLQSILFAVDHFFGGATHHVPLPGPTGFPLVGNLYQMKDGHVQMLTTWIKKFGPVFRVALGEREAVFINSHQSMAQTIVTQGPAFQSRPTFKLFHSDFASSGIWTVGTSPYSDRLARTRKALSTQIAPRLLPEYIPIIQPQLKRLLGLVSDVSKGPALDMAEILHCFGTGMVSEQLVGTALPESLISHMAYNETNIFRQRTIGSPAHDYIPLMRLWNSTLHGVSSKFGLSWGRHEKEEHAREYRRLQQVYINDLLAGLRQRIENGDESPSILGNIMRTASLKPEEILLASYTGIAAGVNLGYSLTWIVGYLANHPELQEKAYEAIREVYKGAVPEPHDFDRVEYVKALHTEGSRYYVPVRLGFPRQTVAETTYNGVKIPSGVLVIMNCFACNRDPAAYDSPDEFIPERWMNGHTGKTDSIEKSVEKLGVPHLTYGAGRRVCPGIEMANRGLYSTLVLLFHFFKWERGALAEEEKKHVFPPFRAQRECTADMDPITDTATPTEAQAIPWACGLKFTPRDPEALAEWLAQQA